MRSPNWALLFLCRRGGMADTADLKSVGVIRVGSNPIAGTRRNYILCYGGTSNNEGGFTMAIDVITVHEAAKILGYCEGYVCQLIRNNVITTAFMRSPDGYGGKPGYGMYRDEIELLARTRVKYAKKRKTIVEVEEREPEKVTTKDLKPILGEIEACLSLLSECLGKLKEEL